jgi:hypothetical protein
MLLSYRRVFVVILMAAAVSAGCRPAEKKYEGPTVPAFTGRLTHKGEPVSFPGEGRVVLQLVFEKGKGPMGVRIQPDDGTFKIGLMPIGKYSMTLIRGRNRYNIPGELTIEEGKTEYEIELGEKWKPSVSDFKQGR